MSDKTAEIEINLPVTDTHTSTTEPTVTPQFCPLLGGHLRIRVDIPSPKGSPLPPAWAIVTPFTPDEGSEYLSELEKLDGKKAEQTAEQRKRLASQIKEWNFSIVSDQPAPINAGTLARIPTWALSQIELAVFGEAGKLLGNS